MGSLLEVRDLSVQYNVDRGASIHAVSEATFTIDPAEIVGVLGESGSGKSTLAASLLAMFPRNATRQHGAILLEGTNLLELNDEELRNRRGKNVSLISQEPGTALHPTIRVGVQIEEVLRAHVDSTKAERRERAVALLRSVFSPGDVERIYGSYPHQLSGGQRQRIVILQAIACRPSLLIADEPTASLDPVTQQEILQLLKRLRAELKLAIFFITHVPELLADFADRIFVMYAGRIIETGKASELLRFPLHPYTRALLACRPRLYSNNEGVRDEHLPVISGDPPDLALRQSCCAFEPRCPERVSICRERLPARTIVDDIAEVRCFKFEVEKGN